MLNFGANIQMFLNFFLISFLCLLVLRLISLALRKGGVKVAIANIVFGVSIVIVSSFGWTFLCNCKMIMPIWFLLIDISSQIQKTHFKSAVKI